MTARGGSGRDDIDGGSGNDWLLGDSGNDEIHGGLGDDKIEGRWGNDKLFGGGGDDTLYGSGGNDYLYGGSGDDNLYGGIDNDRLYGQSGNDGLFGGDNFDRLYAGTGRDRILKDQRNNDSHHNTSSDDAIIWFKNTSSFSNSDSNGITAFFSGGSWNDSSIEAVDKALERLHDLTDNVRLIKTADDQEMTFHRAGNWLGASDGSNFQENLGGVNTRDGNIYMTSQGMSGSQISVEQVAIHEIGHNWDWEGVNSTVDDFYAQSGWTNSPTTVSSGRFSWIVINDTGLNADDNWWYSPFGDGFTSDYARSNPYEDFADSFAAYVMGSDYEGFDASGNPTGGIDDTPGKREYMENFIGGM